MWNQQTASSHHLLPHLQALPHLQRTCFCPRSRPFQGSSLHLVTEHGLAIYSRGIDPQISALGEFWRAVFSPEFPTGLTYAAAWLLPQFIPASSYFLSQVLIPSKYLTSQTSSQHLLLEDPPTQLPILHAQNVLNVCNELENWAIQECVTCLLLPTPGPHWSQGA